ncbi:MAG: AI-2E family transporter [Clostridia bacterium]|nr:AI-2E family transporter [Clostridia bacterium]
MQNGKLERLCCLTVVIIGGALILFLFFKHLFGVILPFLIAWAMAFATRPVAEALARGSKRGKRILRAILALLFSLLVIGVIFLICFVLCSELWRLLSGLGEGDALRDFFDKLLGGGLFGGIFDKLGERVADVFYELLISLAAKLGSVVTSWVGAVPKILLFILITVIASVYFALDLERVNGAVKKILPEAVYGWLSELKRGAFRTGVRYLRSYLILMMLTFIIMLVGLMLLGRPYAVLLAFIIAIADVLPVIGVGSILIPWGIYEIAFGADGIGIGLIILMAVYELIRQFLEPKIVGKNLGVHPLLTLVTLYVGYSLFGFVGLLLVPVVSVIVNVTLEKKNSAEVGKREVSEHNGA